MRNELLRLPFIALALAAVPVAAVQAYVNADHVVPLWALKWNGIRLGEITRRNVISLEDEQLAFNVNPEAGELAKEAYAREPLAADALFTIALSAGMANDEDLLLALISQGSQLQKRNLYIGLLDLSAKAQRGDLDEALAVLDRHVMMHPTHARVLVSALQGQLFSAEQEDVLAAALDRRPAWETAFWDVMSRNPQMHDTLIALRNRPDAVPIASGDRALVANLAKAGRYDDAFRMWRLVDDSASDEFGFSNSAAFAPLGWRLTQRGAIYATVENDSMQVHVDEGRRAVFAEQLVQLAPGRYRLSARGPATDEAAITSRVRCASEQEARGPRAPLNAAFSVGGEGCSTFWLSLEADAMDGGTVDTRIDDLELERIG